jgi:hypothetical protein
MKIQRFAAVLFMSFFVILPFAHGDAKKSGGLKPYPLKTCVVSGEKLGGDMGHPVLYHYRDREIKFCCPDCQKDFDKDPAKFIKQLEAAEAK